MYSHLLERVALPVLGRITPSRFWEHHGEMLRFEALDRAEQERVQARRLREIVAHAFTKVPFYRDLAREEGLDPESIQGLAELTRLPILTKEVVQAAFPDRISAEGMDRGDWRFFSTSGTAQRLMILQDFGKRDVARAAEARSFRLGGDYRLGARMVEIPPDVCNIACGLEGETMGGVWDQVWSMFRDGRLRDEKEIRTLRGRIERDWIYCKRTYPPFDSRGTDQSPEHLADYVARIRADRPYLLKALPTYLHQIARHVLDHGEAPLPVKVVQPMGGSVVPAVRACIEEAFEGEFREQYGSGEFGAMACDCPAGDGMHVFSDLFIIEVVDGEGRPCAEGELGRILVTDLRNLAMPLLRYQIGDIGRLHGEDHGCGRSTPRLHVEGRLQDALVRHDGRMIPSDTICERLYRRGDVEHFQLVELKDDHFELLVVPRNGHAPDAGSLVDELRELLGGDPQIQVFPVKTVHQEESGKYRFVHSSSWSRS